MRAFILIAMDFDSMEARCVAQHQCVCLTLRRARLDSGGQSVRAKLVFPDNLPLKTHVSQCAT